MTNQSDYTPTDELPVIKPRSADSHKGDYGRVLLIGGSRGMCGAIALSGTSTLRSGAGLVTIATADPCVDVVAGFNPCYMTVPLPSDANGRISATAKTVLQPHLDRADVIACGPGLGRSSDLDELVCWLQETVEAPIVFDADALNALSEHPSALKNARGPRVLTPHPGEFARIVNRLGKDEVMQHDEPGKQAVAVVKQCGAVVVLKGHNTVVTDGQELYVNSTGNPGMATGGSGDVLTGIIAAWIGQGFSPMDAAKLAVRVHGLAGDAAEEAMGEISMTANDLIKYLPAAYDRYKRTKQSFGFGGV
ncbi:MAG: ADP-dependent NAD(P)H-hydrate dehydratase [Pirellulaceae bacterium]|jgi:ADP-dependent NAD(P)H-hydrate dehydratase